MFKGINSFIVRSSGSDNSSSVSKSFKISSQCDNLRDLLASDLMIGNS